jgi:hypothetical protein
VSEKGPPEVLYQPKDGKLRSQLEAKLKEYEARQMGGDEKRPWETIHPELAYQLYGGYRDAAHKVDVLRAVLAAPETGVAMEKLYRLAVITYGDDFDADSFTNAWNVIAFYLGDTTGVVTNPGTGLPEVE